MNKQTAGRLVIASMVLTSITVAITYFRKSRKPSQGFKVAWALGALFLILALGADTVPEIAGPLALLILLSTVLFQEDTLAGILHLSPGGGGGAGREPVEEPENGGMEA